MDKYFVTKGNGGFMVISEAFDKENGGNYYKTHSEEYETEAEAIAMAKGMNGLAEYGRKNKLKPTEHMSLLIPLLEYNYARGLYIDILNVIGIEVYGIEVSSLIDDKLTNADCKERAYNEIQNLKYMNTDKCNPLNSLFIPKQGGQ